MSINSINQNLNWPDGATSLLISGKSTTGTYTYPTTLSAGIYAIKATSGNGTGVFASLPLEDDGKVYFEYLILVLFNKDYTLKEIFEITWGQFLLLRKIKPPENKWNLPITQEVKRIARKIK